MYDKTTNDNWTEFADDLTKKMNELQLQSPTIQDETQLNKYWNTWENLLRSSINKHIPYTYSAPRIFHSHSFKATQLHKALTLINKTIIKIKRPITPLTLEHFTNILNSNLQKIQDLSNLEVPTLQSWHLTPTNFRPTLQLLSTIQTTLLKARKLEHSQQKRDTINSFIERRYKNFTDNTTKMINSVLGRYTDRVTFDNIITPTEVITQPDQIKAVTRQHFKNWTRANPPNEEKWQEWEQAYIPLAGFDEKMYLEATTEIPYHEVLDTINKAPINKATGPSTISNEILKKLPTQGIKFLTAIFNACLELRKIPQKWRNSLVWPISKKTQYKGDLSQTRPITLIDHTRKILTKILTERLSKILLRHNILAPQNNVALPHTSTMIPIQQLNHIMEDAQLYNREFWILLQDMSKAYDTVHLPLLNKALNRIHVPLQLRELLINIFSDRKNQVITSIEKTQQYEVLNGINQGEMLSPILWRIYYDPLIHRIATQIKGYQMTTQIPYQPTTLTHNTSVIAFMDDTAWVASNKQEMEAITKLATSFYEMANIRVNPEKSILINNSDDTQNSSLKFQDQTINNIDRNEPFRYLGVWFSRGKSNTSIHNKILQEDKSAIKRLRMAKITAKQAIYIINSVIISRFSYRIQNTYLPPSKLKQLDSQLSNVVKHKAQLARGVPSSTLYHPHIYGLKKTSLTQSAQHICIITKLLNLPAFDQQTLKIRLQQLQTVANTNESILTQQPTFPLGEASTTTAHMIRQVHEENFQFKRTNNKWPIPRKESGTSINWILSDNNRSHTLKHYLNKHNIAYIEQFTNFNNTNLLNWNSFHHNIQKIPRGRKPKWFDEIKQAICDKTTPSLILQIPNPFIWQKQHQNTLKWIITQNMEFGKVSSTRNNTTKIRHYILNPENNQLLPCEKCNLKDPTIKSKKCFIRRPTSSIYSIMVDTNQQWHGQLTDLSHSKMLHTQLPTTQNDQHYLLSKYYITKQYCLAFTNIDKIIWDLYYNNQNKQMHITIKSQQLTNQPNNLPSYNIQLNPPLKTFNLRNVNWPTHNKLLITTLILIWTLLPAKSTVTIITDKIEIKNLINLIAETPSYLKEHKFKGDLSPYLSSLHSIFMSKRNKMEYHNRRTIVNHNHDNRHT